MPKKGYKHSEETKRKISESEKGKIVSLETRKKLSIGQKLRFQKESVWNKGKKGVQKSKWKGKIIPHLKRYQFKEGSNHLNWKGGKSRNIHGGKKYKEWRLKVYKRDNFTCLICQIVGGQLQAHHLMSWVKYPKLRYKVDNGITLCKECHKLIHSKKYLYGTKNKRISK